MVFLYLEPIKFLRNIKLKINRLPNTGSLLNDTLSFAEPCLGTSCWRHGDGWKWLSPALLQESLQPVRKGHHRAGEAERDGWKGCSAQSKDWINPEAARADDNKWQLTPEARPQLG